MHRIGRREREPRKERIVRSASLSKKDARGGTLLRSTQYSTLILSFYKFPINKKKERKMYLRRASCQRHEVDRRAVPRANWNIGGCGEKEWTGATGQ